jgi:hypothetical protein
MTEDDTFDALRRYSYDNALEYYGRIFNKMHAKTVGECDQMLKHTGWTFDELNDEYRRRNL